MKGQTATPLRSPAGGRGSAPARRPTSEFQPAHPILVVTGLAAEARIMAGPDVVCVSAPAAMLAHRLDSVRPAGPYSAIVSFGLAGGLSPRPDAGTLVVADAVSADGETWRTDSTITAKIRRLLENFPMDVIGGSMLGLDAPVMTSAEKTALHLATGAVAVDTESHIAARFAARHSVPFAVIRAVCDTARQDLPPLALRAIGADGRLDLRAVGSELLRRPGQVLSLPGIGLATARAMRGLGRVRRLLGPRLGL